ncbi:MAG: uncharacterized protein KVP18_002395 [Porospora cf. gigantea A]|uniref:uncharacterized protein n=1 Tax=Porospora cf. gigantea A TaxID=2853593 RepID=UPI003559952E|nr:MAG: hypothetical protein KVP18_002395 [Porospora cf. gigantea A]
MLEALSPALLERVMGFFEGSPTFCCQLRQLRLTCKSVHECCKGLPCFLSRESTDRVPVAKRALCKCMTVQDLLAPIPVGVERLDVWKCADFRWLPVSHPTINSVSLSDEAGCLQGLPSYITELHCTPTRFRLADLPALTRLDLYLPLEEHFDLVTDALPTALRSLRIGAHHGRQISLTIGWLPQRLRFLECYFCNVNLEAWPPDLIELDLECVVYLGRTPSIPLGLRTLSATGQLEAQLGLQNDGRSTEIAIGTLPPALSRLNLVCKSLPPVPWLPVRLRHLHLHCPHVQQTWKEEFALRFPGLDLTNGGKTLSNCWSSHCNCWDLANESTKSFPKNRL